MHLFVQIAKDDKTGFLTGNRESLFCFTGIREGSDLP